MKKLLVALLLASSLYGCKKEKAYPQPPAGSVDSADYWTKFEGLGCCILIDGLNTTPKALQPGQGGPDETSAWVSEADALRMDLTAPDKIAPDTTPSMGIFKTRQNFGPGTKFSISATFRNAQGRMDGQAWTVALVARTGDVADTADLGRLQLSLRVNKGVHLRVQEGPDGPSTSAIPGAALPDGSPQPDFVSGDAPYKDIYLDHKPFTLRLDVDRKSGKGVATLTTATQVYPIRFEMGRFKKDGGAPLTTVGVTIANNNPGETVSVEVTDFMIASH